MFNLVILCLSLLELWEILVGKFGISVGRKIWDH